MFLIPTRLLTPVFVIFSCVLSSFVARVSAANNTIKFEPGAARRCDLDVNRMLGGMTLGTLDQFQNVDEFDWVVQNNPAGADREILFTITPAAAHAGASFTVSFTMSLVSVMSGGASVFYGVDTPAGNVYADNTRTAISLSSVRYPTHVFAQATATGTLANNLNLGSSWPATALAQASPTFSQAHFVVFFDADGDTSTTNDQFIIADFGTSAPDPATSFAGTVWLGIGVVNFIVNWDFARPAVFADQNGFELALGGAAPGNASLKQVSDPAARTSKVEVAFRYECPATGACMTTSGNKRIMHLHTMSTASTWIEGVPATTQGPPFVFCDLPRRKFNDKAIDPLSLILSDGMYVITTLPDPPPPGILRAEIEAGLKGKTKAQRQSIQREVGRLRTYLDATDAAVKTFETTGATH
jgi:hypothetical protein